MEYLFRFVKPLVFFIVMFLSLKFLGAETSDAVIASCIPLVLGLTNFMAGTAYSIAGIIFIVAALSALLPPESRSLSGLVKLTTQEFLSDNSLNQPDATTTSNKDKTK